MGRKNACEFREGTCVLLAALCGRPAVDPDTLPVKLVRWEGVLETNPLRGAEVWDHAPRWEEIPVTPVFGLDVASPIAVCVLGLQLCVEIVGSTACPPPSSETISVMREDNTLGASPASECDIRELGAASTGSGLDMAAAALQNEIRQLVIVVLYVWFTLCSFGIPPKS